MLCLHESIRPDDAGVQARLETIEQAETLAELVLAVLALSWIVSVRVVESVLDQRAQRPTVWPPCPQCGARLHSKGFVSREVVSLIGVIRWRRRVGRCPSGCAIGQVAPLDESLGIKPHQRASFERQALGGALAIFVPFATAARFVSWSSACPVSAWAVWQWVQAVGHEAMGRLESELTRLGDGESPERECLEPDLAQAPLILGGDGVMAPFRPHGGHPHGKTQWREIKVGVLARLRRHCRRQGDEVTRLAQRRLVAVLGDIEAFKPRLWLEALRQGLEGVSQVAWLSDGGRGLWRLYEEGLSPRAQGILDFYHAAQNLWKGAAA